MGKSQSPEGILQSPLKDFLRERKERDERKDTVDWEARRRERIKAIASLYDDIERWLKPATDDGIVTLKRRPCELRERHLGTYQTEELDLEVGHARVEFRPESQLVAGASSRVDVVHEGQRVKIVHLLGRGWHFLLRDEATGTTRTLLVTDESFSDFLQDLLDDRELPEE
ncbi:hypothetical protein [Polyangium aurulentum]|uniref:hypothetical protein n=1 Tax=Polyangium aurulentum TaxID=2567896 RepID=UPI0010ADD32F|nr:hypothetical protein [Polyangium aurulentum]UQA62273.1 hypothetical protein E8A73_018090 [Polyangium aurulentum]